MKVSVSILSSSIKPADIVKILDNTKADYIHIDIMDGKFVENKTWTISEIKKITSYSKLPLDVQEYEENFLSYLQRFHDDKNFWNSEGLTEEGKRFYETIYKFINLI